MSSCYELIKTFSVFVVGIQLVFGVFRWFYENVIGPKFLEPTNLRQYGKWACKFYENVLILPSLIVYTHFPAIFTVTDKNSIFVIF